LSPKDVVLWNSSSYPRFIGECDMESLDVRLRTILLKDCCVHGVRGGWGWAGVMMGRGASSLFWFRIRCVGTKGGRVVVE